MIKKRIIYLAILLTIGFVSINSCNKGDDCLKQTWYQDSDGDGFGNSTISQQSCDQPMGYVSDNTDCDDNDRSINPEAPDNTLDGVDNNCNDIVDEDVSSVRYNVEVINTWSSQSPAWPDQDAHFSWIGGTTHSANMKLWEVGALASPGIDQMSISGNTTELVSEIEIEIANGNAENLINLRQWFCPDEISHSQCGELSFEITVTKNFPLVSLASMLGPSPDWFIGVESLSMVDNNGAFITQIVYELFPHDAGILSDNSVLISDCCEREPLSVPQENIHLITLESGETIGPSSLGQIIFTIIQ